MSEFIIRATTTEDHAALLALSQAAFAGEDLRPLVSGLLTNGPSVLSLTAITGSGLCGHIVFTRCGGGADDGNAPAALLGPLAVAPSVQRRGLGKVLVDAGLTRLQRQGARQVFVLGDPAYYGRFGFVPEQAVLPPYPMPAEWAGAWQSLVFAGVSPLPAGPLRLPPVWMQPALWQP